MGKELIFIIKCMVGGGAERVVSLLSSNAVKRGYDVTLMITGQPMNEAEISDIDKSIKVISVPDSIKSNAKMSSDGIMLYARAVGKLTKQSDKSRILKYEARNYDRILFMRSFFKMHKNSAVVAFLYDSIFLSLLSVNKTNRLIISERGDPEQTTSETTKSFIKSEFKNADCFVFQSYGVEEWYKKNTPVRGTVIFNPVKSDLPEPFEGERKKRVVNFCRISPEKNLTMLVAAFFLFHEYFPDYELFIYGDAVGTDVQGYIDKVNNEIKKNSLESSVHIFPARRDVHTLIYDCSMFVSSSDYEGMSNSMLEAMAMGMPCVCTDCPAGGARAVIKNEVNGLLTPVGDAQALADAMIRIAENPDFAEKLGKNAMKIRKTQSVEKITDRWMEIIDG